MAHYLVQIRFFGSAKLYLTDLIHDISREFNVHGATKKRPVPHISLAGPLTTGDEERLVREVFDVVKKYDMVEYFLDGFGKFSKFLFLKRVIYVHIEPSEELIEMRKEISNTLEGFCKMQDIDYKDDFEFHATIAFKDINWNFVKILKYVQKLPTPKIEQTLLRVSIIKTANKERRLLREYDLILRRELSREQALDVKLLQHTISVLRKRREVLPEDFWDVPDSEGDGEIFLISDTHFDHENIIRYCHRPFKSVTEMNKTLVDRWNSKVGKDDTVYFMGDLTLEREKLDYWLGKLNGKIKFIRGNHDKGMITKAEELQDRCPLVYKGHKFLLTHDPNRPANWDGWLIHGDKHNNSLENYPFMNHEKKTINICSELVGYTPISIDTIILNLSKNEQKNYRYYEGEQDHQNSEHGEDHRHEHRDSRSEHRTGPRGSRQEHGSRHQNNKRGHRHEQHDHRRDHRHEQSSTTREQTGHRVYTSTHYEILGVQKNATPEEIKTAFRKCILKWHSDKNKIEDADEYTKLLYEARDVLLDSTKRHQYDRTI
jgi:calcineurin-like phosphoesterase family protein/2'-5' RNA ligase